MGKRRVTWVRKDRLSPVRFWCSKILIILCDVNSYATTTIVAGVLGTFFRPECIYVVAAVGGKVKKCKIYRFSFFRRPMSGEKYPNGWFLVLNCVA